MSLCWLTHKSSSWLLLPLMPWLICIPADFIVYITSVTSPEWNEGVVLCTAGFPWFLLRHFLFEWLFSPYSAPSQKGEMPARMGANSCDLPFRTGHLTVTGSTGSWFMAVLMAGSQHIWCTIDALYMSWVSLVSDRVPVWLYAVVVDVGFQWFWVVNSLKEVGQ